MRRINLLWLMLGMMVTALPVHAQRTTEFSVYPSGLIYSDTAMTALRTIVKRENLRFRACPPGPQWHALPQAPCIRLTFAGEGRDCDSVKKAMDDRVPPDRMRATFARLLKQDDPVETMIQVDRPESDRKIVYSMGNGVDGYYARYHVVKRPEPHQWQVHASTSTWGDGPMKVDGIWVRAPFTSQPLHEDLARCAQYVDCLVDTTTTVILENTYDKRSMPSVMKPVMKRIQSMNDSITYESLRWSSDQEAYWTQIRTTLVPDTSFVRLVRTVADTMIARRIASEQMERLLEEIGSPRQQLALMRMRTVYGTCSMDERPRQHGRSIAQLAGETQEWSVFMRAHLELLNDDFERLSDGSYAWGERYTYIRELEELGIDVVDLTIGLVVRYAEMAKGHYTGAPSRVGRAMSESRDSTRFTERIMGYLRDTSIDAFNRDLLFMTYVAYILETENPELQKKRLDDFVALAPTLPDEVRTMVLKLK